MATLKDLRNRIKSVKSTQKITKAMKMVAAAKLRKAQDRAEKGRPYSDKMNSIITNLKASIINPSSAPKLLVGNAKSHKHLCVVMTADRGLCGGFNTNICRRARIFFNDIINSGKELKIITVGSKGNDQLKRMDATHGETGSPAPVEAAAAIRGPCEDARQIFAVIVH